MDIITTLIMASFHPPLVAFLEKRYWTKNQIDALSALILLFLTIVLTVLKHLYLQIPLERTPEFLHQVLYQALALKGASWATEKLIWQKTPYINVLRSINSGENDV